MSAKTKYGFQFIMNVIAIVTFFIGAIVFWVRVEIYLDKIDSNIEAIKELEQADKENGRAWIKQSELNGKIIYVFEHED